MIWHMLPGVDWQHPAAGRACALCLILWQETHTLYHHHHHRHYHHHHHYHYHLDKLKPMALWNHFPDTHDENVKNWHQMSVTHSKSQSLSPPPTPTSIQPLNLSASQFVGKEAIHSQGRSGMAGPSGMQRWRDTSSVSSVSEWCSIVASKVLRCVRASPSAVFYFAF